LGCRIQFGEETDEVSSPSPRPESEENFETMSKPSLSLSIVREIVVTEERYVKNLEIICNEFLKPLRLHAAHSSKALIADSSFVDNVFLNIEEIYKVHKVFLKKLQSVDLESEAACIEIPLIMKDCSPFLKIYKEYAGEYSKSQSLLNNARRDNVYLNEVLSVREAISAEPLESLLSSPISRVLRYKLLMERLACEMLSEECWHSLNAIKSVARAIDTGVELKESQAMVLKLQKEMFHDNIDLAKEGRHFIGSFKARLLSKVSSSKEVQAETYFFRSSRRPSLESLQKKLRKEFKTVRVLIFNDLLVIATLPRLNISGKVIYQFDLNSNFSMMQNEEKDNVLEMGYGDEKILLDFLSIESKDNFIYKMVKLIF
jgi:hypothetical protein